ncbi:radical SAM protein [Parachitinimonas caeni]|uniref:Radical SAM protein n=1 Tax=Parachitinimonas caeni TaxID=3031301 RepID=A0ABT7E0Q6_9NEIS|nr:radical SAM protein [Parachitinimonas caeni]MDK2125881.1 radical SAM protein [Parachitinimonas caeni]
MNLSISQKQQISEAINPKHLSLTILPTEKCNFRCTYCYEDFSIGKMPANKVLAIKQLILSRMKDLTTLRLNWFGGEPLIASDILLDLSSFAKNECEKYGISFLSGDITTNGSLLSKELLEKLIAANQKSFQISLDGWQEGHNQTRKSGNAEGTFNAIWSNLLMMRDTHFDFSTTIRVHLTDSNFGSAKQLAHEIVKEFSTDKRFNVFIKAIENLGGPNKNKVNSLSENERKAQSNELEEIFRPLKQSDTSSLLQGGYICYASKPNHLVIRADGRIAKCTVAFDDPKNAVGLLQDDGTLSFDNEKLSHWFRGIIRRDAEIMACPVFIRQHEKVPQGKRVIKIAQEAIV